MKHLPAIIFVSCLAALVGVWSLAYVPAGKMLVAAWDAITTTDQEMIEGGRYTVVTNAWGTGAAYLTRTGRLVYPNPFSSK